MKPLLQPRLSGCCHSGLECQFEGTKHRFWVWPRGVSKETGVCARTEWARSILNMVDTLHPVEAEQEGKDCKEELFLSLSWNCCTLSMPSGSRTPGLLTFGLQDVGSQTLD